MSSATEPIVLASERAELTCDVLAVQWDYEEARRDGRHGEAALLAGLIRVHLNVLGHPSSDLWWDAWREHYVAIRRLRSVATT